MLDDPCNIYGTSFECSCGRTHDINPKAVVYADDAMVRMSAACAEFSDGRTCVVIDDIRTRAVAGDEVARAMTQGGWIVRRLLLEDPAPGEDPVCDDHTHARLLPQVKGADLLLPVGSGVINDLGKWLAHDIGASYVSFATAASMNGYTSASVAPKIAGVKTLTPAQPPALVFSVPQVIAEAPLRMTTSGLGDVLARSVSSVDWYLNHVLFGDYYCQRSVDLVVGLEPLYLEHGERIRARDEAALAAMFDALLLTGVATTMAGSSTPASGGEHLISHSLDMLSAIDGRPHDLHGRQVGVGTILCAELYCRVLAVESPELVDPPASVDRELWGPLADEVADKFGQKRERLQLARDALGRGDCWDRLREALFAMLRPPEQLRRCLEQAGAAVEAEHIGCDANRLTIAFTRGHQIRARYTVLDLAWLLGLMPKVAHEIVEQWA
ncbi:MAG: iron-containing alcohol dehydrogenase [Enhygromyxa sp.]